MAGKSVGLKPAHHCGEITAKTCTSQPQSTTPVKVIHLRNRICFAGIVK